MHFAVFADRYVFAGYKALFGKMITHGVVTASGDVVLECPASACTMDQMAEVVVLARAETRNPASFAVVFPHVLINVSVQIERRNDYIRDIGITLRMPGFARQRQPDLTKTCRQA